VGDLEFGVVFFFGGGGWRFVKGKVVVAVNAMLEDWLCSFTHF
jgi:hypothetical protein